MIGASTTTSSIFDIEFLGRAAIRIVNEVSGINRMACHITSNRGTIEWE